MKDLVVILVLAVIIGAAVRYIIKAKKNGAKCIGCPSGGCCPSKNNGEQCSCGCNTKE